MNGLRNVRILDGEDAIGCTYVLTYNKYFSCRQPKLIKMGGALLLNFYNDVIILTYLVTFCIIAQCTLSSGSVMDNVQGGPGGLPGRED